MDPNKYSYKPYEAIFVELFNEEKTNIQKILPLNSIIEHFGSSSIPGLGGKGIIDIYVLTPLNKHKYVSSLLESKLSYEHRQAGDSEDRLFFRKNKIDKSGVNRTYHLHLGPQNSSNFKQSIALRDYLKTHKKAVQQYDKIKKQASIKAMKESDYEKQKTTYQNEKSALISRLNKKAIKWYKNSQ